MKAKSLITSLACVFLLLGCKTSKFDDYEKPTQTAETQKVDENTKPTATPETKIEPTETPTSKVIGYLNVTTDQMNVRATPSIQGEVVGTSSIGVYEVLDQVEADEYTWCQIAENEWIAQNDVYSAFTKEKPSTTE